MIRRFLLPAVALLGLFIVLLAPQTGWLARMQVKMAWFGRGEAEVKKLVTAPAPVATTPAMETAWSLNTLCTEKSTWRRSDLEYLVGNPGPEDSEPLHFASTEEVLQLCAVGEQQDPQNAFFTVLRGAALFASHKDAAALEALHVAAQKPNFDSYYGAALNGIYRQLKAQGARGLTETVLPLYVAGGTGEAWSENFRFFFWSAMAHALKRQVAGDLNRSVALRSDLCRIVDLQRQKEFYVLPKYAQIAQPLPKSAMVSKLERGAMAGGGYGGAGSAVQYPVRLGPTLTSKQRLLYYPLFLREQGYAQEAAAFEKSLALSKAMIKGLKARQERGEDVVGAMSYVHRMSLWEWWGLLLLASVITTLNCGALARILLFTQGVEVVKKRRIGALLVFLVLVPLIGSAWHGPMDDAVAAWVERVVQPCYSAGGDSDPAPWYADLQESLNRWGSNIPIIAMALAPVLLTQFIGGIWALVKHKPLGQGIMGGVWRASVPVAAVTLLVWCGGVMWLAKEEARQLARFSVVLQRGD